MLKNIEQEKAIECINGSSILISCPGSGKTTTLLRRIHHIVETGVEPNRILMITFTKAAAKEMREKYRSRYGKPDGIDFSTIHALCFKILVNYGGYTRESILNDSEAWFYLTRIAAKDPRVNDSASTVKQFMTQYSAAINNQITEEKINPEGMQKDVYRNLALAYEHLKKQSGQIDFDDMLIFTIDLLNENPDILEELQNKWDYIQVDEYQDTNLIQKELIYLLARRHRNLCVAGDDDQSIYGFRGARSEVMMDFEKDFPDVQKFFISTNYRSLPGIIKYANILIQNNKKRFPKKFLSSREGTAVVRVRGTKNSTEQYAALEKSIRENDHPFDDIAILYRSNQQAEALADYLYKKKIPFQSTESIPDSYSHWIWNDIIAYYRLAAHVSGTKKMDQKSYESDMRRILDRPTRYLGRVTKAAADMSEEGLCSAVADTLSGWQYEKGLKAVRQLFMHLLILGKKNPLDFITYLYTTVRYEKYVMDYASETNQDDFIFSNSLRIYKEDAARFKSMDEWLKYIRIRSMSLKQKTESGVTLSTMHRSKGLEFGSVFIIDCNEGIVPSKKCEDIEEERRLFYVAMTRAKEELTMMYLKSVGNKKERSRFLNEIMKPEMETKPDATSFQKNDLVMHNAFGMCMVIDARGDRCRIVSLEDHEEHLVLKCYLKKRSQAPGNEDS